jgi:hypothetical protein
VGSFWATWQIAGFSLGHTPRPSLDDPKYINEVVSGLHGGTTLMLMLLPGFALSSLLFGATAAFDRARAGKRLVVASASALLLTAAILLLRADPFSIVTWFMD